MRGDGGLDELYQSVILDHYRNPRNAVPLSEFDLEIHKENPFCGDESDVRIRIRKDARIDAISVSGRGCAISQSSGSLMASVAEGLAVVDAKKLNENFRILLKDQNLTEKERESLGDLEALAGVRKFPIRIKCALLPWSALEEVLKR